MSATQGPNRSALPVLGVGIGYRSPFRADLFRDPGAADFLEITIEHFLDATEARTDELRLLARHFPLAPHGLNLSLGSAEGIDRGYVEKVAAFLRSLDPAPPWWSEHIACTRTDGIDIGHVSPLPFTREAVDVVCRNLREVQKIIDLPILLENITAVVEFPSGEFSEGEFLAEIAERSGCGLLLDVTNLHANAVNFRRDSVRELERLPLDRVTQLHFVGGHWEDGLLIDSHSRPTMPEVWDLMNEVLKRCPVKGVILERDENLPPFEELAAEMRQARELGERHGRWVSRNSNDSWRDSTPTLESAASSRPTPVASAASSA